MPGPIFGTASGRGRTRVEHSPVVYRDFVY